MRQKSGLEDLLANGEFARTKRVIEFGCGAGRFAEELLASHLPRDASWVGCDIDAAMCDLARERLGRFGNRAEVQRTDGSTRLPFDDGSFDCFLTTYVLDLLGQEDIADLLQEARRLLVCGGRLCAVNTTGSPEGSGHDESGVRKLFRAIRPGEATGRGPVDLAVRLHRADWEVLHEATVATFGIPSEVVVARARASCGVSS